MQFNETLEIQSTESDERKGLIFIRKGQLVFICILEIALITGVGLMSYYLPDRGCEPPISEPTTEAIKTEQMPTEDVLTTEEPVYQCRLPRDVIPISYEIFIKPYLNEEDVEGTEKERFTFDGRVVILMKCQNETNRITLHLQDIEISSVSLTGPDLDVIPTFEYDTFSRIVHIDIDSNEFLKVGEEYSLTIDYIGQISDFHSGIYRGSYTDSAGSTHWYATSQMQSVYARRALPCFDEPDMKATFKTTIEYRSDMVALTNGIEEEEEDLENGWIRTSYKVTPIMPTYLLAFTIGKFDYLEATTSNGCRFRTWARPEELHNAEYALDIGVRMQEYFEDYFGIDYPLEKQDMIAVTKFSGGAMENWGLIIYRESAMLFDPVVNYARNKLSVGITVAHELAHMWFGNLVSPSSWDHLWLNEGFASYLEYLGVQEVEPEWQAMQQFLPKAIQYVMETDSSGSSRPLVVPTCTPADSQYMFTSITYDKGAAIVRMMNSMFSEPIFLDGLKTYLNKFAYGNAETDDLWAVLTEADKGHGNHDVKEIMDTWTLQMGYPLITFEREDKIVKAHQKHYLRDPAAGVDPTHGDLGYLWWVNLLYTDKSQGNTGGTGDFQSPQSAWMEATADSEFPLDDNVQTDDWYIVNTHQYGFYRVNYDTENWERLANQLYNDHEVFPVENRAQLIDDAFTLARRGNLSQDTALDLVAYMHNEREYLPWDNMIEYTDYIGTMYRENAGFGDLQTFMRHQLEPLYTALGWDDSPNVLEQYNRNNMIEQACFYRVEDCINTASEIFAQYMMNSAINPISMNIRSTVYNTAIREGGEKEWDFGWEQLLQTSDSSERSSWLNALGCSRHPWILNQYLWFAIDENYELTSDFETVLSAVARNPAGEHVAWDFLRNQWDTISDLYGGSSSSLASLISSVAYDFNTQQRLDELVDFGQSKEEISDSDTFEEAVEQTKTNIWWMENNEDNITRWLRNYFENWLSTISSESTDAVYTAK